MNLKSPEILDRSDTRAVSPIIASVLMFGIIIVLFSTYQAYAVPSQNSGVEFDHNQRLHSDMQELRDVILNSGLAELERSTTVALGTQFENRFVLVNPPDPSGRLQTEEPPSGIAIENATVANQNEFLDDVSILLGTEHDTRLVSYTPRYFEYDDAPSTRIEHSLTYNVFPNGNALSITDQRLIEGDTVEIVLLDGNLSQTRSGSFTVDPHLISGPTPQIEIESNGDPITITIPTQNPDIWIRSLSEVNSVQQVTSNDTSVTIQLVDDTYTLRMALVGIGNGYDSDDDTFDIERAPPTVTGGSSLPGPEVTALALNESDVQQGDPVRIDSTFNNTGTTSANRGGTAIEGAEWYLVEEGDPGQGDANSLNSTDFGNLVIDATGIIDTSALDPGDYTVSVRAQDSRGVWTNESVDGMTETFTVSVNGGPPTGPFFEVTIDDTNSPVAEGETVQVNATIENTGDVEDTQDITLDIDGGVQDTVTETIGAGDSVTVLLEWVTATGDAGDYTATVSSDNDSAAENIAVDEPANFVVTITDTNSPVLEGETMEVTALIENTGDIGDTQDIILDIDGGQQDTVTETIAGGDSVVVVLEWDTGAGDTGTHTATISSDDDSDSTAVAVGQPAVFTSLTADHSGPGANINEVTFDWTTQGSVDNTTFTVYDNGGAVIDSETLTGGNAESGTTTFTFGNEQGITLEAITEGPVGGESCVSESLSGNGQVTLDDFTCTEF